MKMIQIYGQGLAGTCLAWQLWWRKADFALCDRNTETGSSRAAAGLLNPVTGRNFEPSWRIGEFLPEAKAFYARVGEELGSTPFHELEMGRLFANTHEQAKFDSKRQALSPWTGQELPPQQLAELGIKSPLGGVVFTGGGWLDCNAFLEESLKFFRQKGVTEHSTEPVEAEVHATGAAGLREGPFAFLPSRPMKGEILTVRLEGFSEERAWVRGGWLLPIGKGLFRVGAGYDAEHIDEQPTEAGLTHGTRILCSFTDFPYTLVKHVAGIRPIIRRSIPLIGRHPHQQGLWLINGLGSKGSLYAPGVAARLAETLLHRTPIDPHLALETFVKRLHHQS